MELCLTLPVQTTLSDLLRGASPSSAIARPEAQQALRTHILSLLLFPVLRQPHRETPRHLVCVCAFKIQFFKRNQAIHREY